MMLNVRRDILRDDCTLGTLFVNGHAFCYTCEDAVRMHKIKGKTAIPYGEYQVIVNFSKRFQKMMPLLLAVPEFEGVRIHAGNSASETEGCILVGQDRTDNGVAKSRAAFDLLMPEIEEAIASKQEVKCLIN